MKIYKNNLMSLLDEADKMLPVYLMISSHKKDLFVELRVNVTAFTPEKTVLHLPYTTYNGIYHNDEVKKAWKKCNEVCDEMILQIEERGFKHSEGLIHDEVVPCNGY